jgi:segregation and condensation protein B
VGRATNELKAVIEALIFASPDPLTPKTLFKLLESEPRRDVEASIAALTDDYAQARGLHLVEVAGGYQIVTRPGAHEWVRRLFHERRSQKLSRALESTGRRRLQAADHAPEITEIRGVNTSAVLATLLERRLIKIAGRKQVVGRPFLYATTREFLIRFGLNDLGDLPKIEDMADVLGFEPPLGLALSGPSERLLPLEPESGEAPAPEPGRDEPPHRVH